MPDATTAADFLEPAYVHSANEAISLGSVDLEFKVSGQTRRENASAVLRFTPDAAVELGFSLRSGVDTSLEDGLWMTPGSGKPFQANPIHSHCETGTVAFVPKNAPVEPFPSISFISSATCHLFNLPNFSIPTVNRAKISANPKDRRLVILRAGGWEITIACTIQTKGLVKQLEERGGYAPTHMVKIAKEDGSTFSDVDLSEALDCLYWFLSFCFGRRTGVGLPVGVDKTGKKVWEQWGFPVCARGAWKSGTCCFDVQHGEILASVFPGFWQLWTDRRWQPHLTYAVDWYLRANVAEGSETGIILGQVALELLAWKYCIQIHNICSPNGFKKLTAADRLRLLLSNLSIPPSIPPRSVPLSTPYADVAEAITRIRNDLVHVEVRSPASANDVCGARALSLWIIEMVILRLCEHDGQYANRLIVPRWPESMEYVPWVASKML